MLKITGEKTQNHLREHVRETLAAIMEPEWIYSGSSAYMLLLLALCFGGTTNSESGSATDSFACSCDPFPPTELPYPAPI